jgi:signal transduction histidine kinase
MLRHKADAEKIQLELDLQPIPSVSCYPAKINQVIMNLVANAIDASAAGGKIIVRSVPDGDGVRVEVIDHGQGIDPVIRSKIFDPFFTTKPPGKGTGLGLSISYGIIRDHDGRIDVESTVGAGSRFAVWIPQHKAA